MSKGKIDKDRRIEARHKILRYLSGQLEAAISSGDPGNWLSRDLNGDKLSDEERRLSLIEAESICAELGVMTGFRIEMLL